MILIELGYASVVIIIKCTAINYMLYIKYINGARAIRSSLPSSHTARHPSSQTTTPATFLNRLFSVFSARPFFFIFAACALSFLLARCFDIRHG